MVGRERLGSYTDFTLGKVRFNEMYASFGETHAGVSLAHRSVGDGVLS